MQQPFLSRCCGILHGEGKSIHFTRGSKSTFGHQPFRTDHIVALQSSVSMKTFAQIRYISLAQLIRERIIEYCLPSTDGPLISSTLKQFINDVSARSSAPGGEVEILFNIQN